MSILVVICDLYLVAFIIIAELKSLMDYVKQNYIQGRYMVFFKAHAYSILLCLTYSESVLCLSNLTPLIHQNELVANYWKLYGRSSSVFSNEPAQKVAC